MRRTEEDEEAIDTRIPPSLLSPREASPAFLPPFPPCMLLTPDLHLIPLLPDSQTRFFSPSILIFMIFGRSLPPGRSLFLALLLFRPSFCRILVWLVLVQAAASYDALRGQLVTKARLQSNYSHVIG